MYTQSALRLALFYGVALLSLSMVFFSPATFAQSNSSNFVFLLAPGFLCNPDDSSACPAVAKADAGDSYELTGAGTFNAQSKSLKAAGTYAHKSPNGNVLETGVWIGSELLSFVRGAHLPARSSLAVPLFWIRLPLLLASSLSRMPYTERFLRDCTERDSEPSEKPGPRCDGPEHYDAEHRQPTCRHRTPVEYSEELGGRVMFLAMQAEVSTPAKAPEEVNVPETSEQPHN